MKEGLFNHQKDIQDITTFMSTEVYRSLSEDIRKAIVIRRSELCLDNILPQLQGLHRNKYKGCFAPHKPVMMLAVMELIANGSITDTKIVADDRLKDSFKRIWNSYVPKGSPFNCDWRNPFTYLDHEEFWTLCSDNNTAILSVEMFTAMKSERNRLVIKELLVDMIKSDTLSKEYAIKHPFLNTMVAEDLTSIAVAFPILSILIG